jgi:hypothetical protein
MGVSFPSTEVPLKRTALALLVPDNTHDVLLGPSAPITVSDPFTITPALRWAWTHFAWTGFADEQVLFGSLAIGAGL